jgi:hypothetical protein
MQTDILQKRLVHFVRSFCNPQAAILEAFSDLPDPRRRAGQRHSQTLCLALFTVAIAAGNKGFLAIGDWIRAYRVELVELFEPHKGRLPSYSTNTVQLSPKLV